LTFLSARLLTVDLTMHHLLHHGYPQSFFVSTSFYNLFLPERRLSIRHLVDIRRLHIFFGQLHSDLVDSFRLLLPWASELKLAFFLQLSKFDLRLFYLLL